MTSPAEVREHIKELVQRDDLQAHTSVPERITGPCVFVVPDEPYLTREGARYGCVFVGTQVVVVGPKGTNRTQADRLDELLLQVIGDLEVNDVGLYVGDVDRPGAISLGGQDYLAAAIDTQIEINYREGP